MKKLLSALIAATFGTVSLGAIAAEPAASAEPAKVMTKTAAKHHHHKKAAKKETAKEEAAEKGSGKK